ncbi:MAG: cation transporter, partial [Lautropia sp.]
MTTKSAPAPTHDHGHSQGHSHNQAAGHGDAFAPAGSRFRVPAMDCASEESDIRRGLEAVDGIRSLGFRLGERSLHIDADTPALAQAVASIRAIGYEIHPWPQPGAGEPADPQGHHGGASPGLTRLLVALALAIGAELLALAGPDSLAVKSLGMAVAAAAIGFAGLDVVRKGLTALRHRRLNINALMTVAVCGAFAIGQWPEAAMVMALYAIAELIEARSVDRARDAISGLLALAPDTAAVRQADGGWSTLAVQAVMPDA